jgi:hypothetical protein
MFPRAKATRVKGLAITFLECPAIVSEDLNVSEGINNKNQGVYEAFQGSRSMKAAPNVPIRNQSARRPAYSSEFR